MPFGHTIQPPETLTVKRRYLYGDIVHYKVSGEGHGATHAIDEKILLDFLEDEQ